MQYKSRLLREAVGGVLVCYSIITAAANVPIRLDLFDASDNSLMYITFEYQNNVNVSRTVYMADSTFIRRVVVNRNAEGVRTSDVSFNYNDDTSFVTSYQPSGAATQVKIVDQFKMDQIGGTVNYSTSDNANYDLTFSKTGATAAKMAYEKDAQGNLTRVTVFDKAGLPQYYGIFTNGTAGVTRPNLRTAAQGATASVKQHGARQLELSLNLAAAAEVRCELITLAGRSAGELFNDVMKAGRQKQLLRIDGKDRSRVADGVYLLSVSVNGKTVLRSRYLHQNAAIGGGR